MTPADSARYWRRRACLDIAFSAVVLAWILGFAFGWWPL